MEAELELGGPRIGAKLREVGKKYLFDSRIENSASGFALWATP